jgi:hypothetical protein
VLGSARSKPKSEEEMKEGKNESEEEKKNGKGKDTCSMG